MGLPARKLAGQTTSGHDGAAPRVFLERGIILSHRGVTRKIVQSTRLFSQIEHSEFLKEVLERRVNESASHLANQSFNICAEFIVRGLGLYLSVSLSSVIHDSDLLEKIWVIYGDFIKGLYAGLYTEAQAFARNTDDILDLQNTVQSHLMNLRRYTTVPTVLYDDRSDKDENARDFLRRTYGHWLFQDKITLSELRILDLKLWRALRNWAHHAQVNLDDVIPRGGRKKPGPKPSGSEEERAERRRQQTRERVQRLRRRKADLTPS